MIDLVEHRAVDVIRTFERFETEKGSDGGEYLRLKGVLIYSQALVLQPNLLTVFPNCNSIEQVEQLLKNASEIAFSGFECEIDGTHLTGMGVAVMSICEWHLERAFVNMEHATF